MAARRAVPVRRRRSLTGIDSRDAAGGERGEPLYTPYDPRTPPCLVWWRASLPHVVYLVRRSPQGASRRASSRFAGDMRACCGAPALRGSPPRPGSLGWWFFPDYALTGGEFCSLHGNFPLRVESFQTGRFFFSAVGLRLQPGIRAWSPARRAAGGERGEPLYTPYDPRTPPCPVWRRVSLSHVVYLVRSSPQGASRRASSRFAGDMRACCGAPALRGSPPRPGSLMLRAFLSSVS